MTNRIHSNGKSIKIEVDVVILREDEYFVAYCPALELSAYGKKEKEALASFKNEINIFIEETAKKGTLEKYLLKQGWKLQQTPKINYRPPKLSNQIMRSAKGKYLQEVTIPY